MPLLKDVIESMHGNLIEKNATDLSFVIARSAATWQSRKLKWLLNLHFKRLPRRLAMTREIGDCPQFLSISRKEARPFFWNVKC
jgi:hypothetical protein